MTPILIGIGILAIVATVMILLGGNSPQDPSKDDADFARLLSLSCGELQALLLLPDQIEQDRRRRPDTRSEDR